MQKKKIKYLKFFSTYSPLNLAKQVNKKFKSMRHNEPHLKLAKIIKYEMREKLAKIIKYEMRERKKD